VMRWVFTLTSGCRPLGYPCGSCVPPLWTYRRRSSNFAQLGRNTRSHRHLVGDDGWL